MCCGHIRDGEAVTKWALMLSVFLWLMLLVSFFFFWKLNFLLTELIKHSWHSWPQYTVTFKLDLFKCDFF